MADEHTVNKDQLRTLTYAQSPTGLDVCFVNFES